jgi:thiol-disulfide isomerase/thioredoxin
MPRTSSTMQALGTTAVDFSLPDGNGAMHSFKSCRGDKGTLVIFMCNHCPFVVHVAEELSKLGSDYSDRGIGIVGINSNDVDKYPDDAPVKMVETAKAWDLDFPYLHDDSQEIARKHQAACTPDFFLYDQGDTLVYRGQLCESRPGSDTPVTGDDLRAALDAVIAGDRPSDDQKPSIGCNIKWKE